MVDLVAQHMKPLEVVVDSAPIPERGLLIEPRIVAALEFGQCCCTNPVELADVVGQLAPSDLSPRSFAKRERSVPFRVLLIIEFATIERSRLVAYFCAGKMGQKPADRVAFCVRQVIKVHHVEVGDCRKGGRAYVVQHGHETADLRRESRYLDNQQVSSGHHVSSSRPSYRSSAAAAWSDGTFS